MMTKPEDINLQDNIQYIKRQMIEQTGQPITDEDALLMATFFFRCCITVPQENWMDIFAGSISMMLLRKDHWGDRGGQS